MRNDSRSQIKSASGFNLLLGLWLIIAPFLLSYATSASRGNDITIGIIVALLAAFRLLGVYRAAWLSWLNALLGIWLIIAPFVLRYGSSSALWNDVIVGLFIAFLGLWSATASRSGSSL